MTETRTVQTAPARGRQTPLHGKHLALDAKMVDFAGWDMPLMYPGGVVAEHLATRRAAGLFDVSHMGRLALSGPGALGFLQHVLSNNAAALEPGQAQYTFLPSATGGAVDDAYLYRFLPDEYLLVVNAGNHDKDMAHLQAQLEAWLKPSSEPSAVTLRDRTASLAMLSLQGPRSREFVAGLLESGTLPEPRRNECSLVGMVGSRVLLSRTGYTGEPLGFELFLEAEAAPLLWDRLVERGAVPCGLGARDTLRLEAGLPLYGHELGFDPEGREIPVFSSPLAAFAVSTSALKGDFIGRNELVRQREAYRRLLAHDHSLQADLPYLTRPLAVLSRGVARAASPVLREGSAVGWVTSGTMVPYWKTVGEGLRSHPGEEYELRSICLALLCSDIDEGDTVAIDVRGRLLEAVVVPHHLRSDAPPFARPIVYQPPSPPSRPAAPDIRKAVGRLLAGTVKNHRWRQEECVNLIPSEMTPSPLVRLVSISDPAFRYAEHRRLEAFADLDVFYYQGTGFIDEVERALEAELCRFLDSAEAETRVISGQMANTVVFSALVDYLNRWDRKAEPRRLAMVMNNHIGRGGHLSAQPMGALKDYVAIDPRTDRPAVVNFPVLAGDPYRLDVAATLEAIERYRPELIIFGKSMVLYKEPVAEVRRFIDEHGFATVIMYDMAHVLGLVGPHFQRPFAEGADLVTGSTHKTFFGTQRGLIAGSLREGDDRHELWESVRRRTFPGAVSNHHLGTLLGLLVAAYEMNEFKDAYQAAVIANAKAFARALADNGLQVAGDPTLGYTETHQVIVKVGYGRGPELAARLEANDIICNYQAAPDEEGFTAAGALRLGVAEMTRFGMAPQGFAELAALMAAVIQHDAHVKSQVNRLRGRFTRMHYCFGEEDFPEGLALLRRLL
jgi:aminomethyltransferase